MDLIQRQKLIFGQGWVMHSRPRSPKNNLNFSNSFRYPIFNLLIPVYDEKETANINQKKGLSIRAADYLNSQEGSLKQNFIDFIAAEFNYACDEVWLQTLPRLFGYVFNPVSFWYCYKNKKLDAVVCEVNNTFGDRHFYFIKDLSNVNHSTHHAIKRFHVSPFFDISGYYTFAFNISDNKNQATIRLHDESGDLKLDTRIELNFKPFDEISLFYILKKYGWITPLVIFRIHFQALKLWFKGALFFRRPSVPGAKSTYSFSKNKDDESR